MTRPLSPWCPQPWPSPSTATAPRLLGAPSGTSSFSQPPRSPLARIRGAAAPRAAMAAANKGSRRPRWPTTATPDCREPVRRLQRPPWRRRRQPVASPPAAVEPLLQACHPISCGGADLRPAPPRRELRPPWEAAAAGRDSSSSSRQDRRSPPRSPLPRSGGATCCSASTPA